MFWRHRPIRRCTIFIHIPKTAGTSLRRVVEEAYGPDRVAAIYSSELRDPGSWEALRERIDGASAVFGHFSFGVHRRLGIDARYVTILRDPLARVVSFYRHQERDPFGDYHSLIAGGMTIADFVRSEKCYQVNNHMVRMLSAEDGIEAVGGSGVFETIDDRRLLDRALANLDSHFAFVGLSERLDESVAGLGAALGWRARPLVPRLNVDATRETLAVDDETCAAVEQYNALDRELYEEVARRFAGSLAPRSSRRRSR